MNLYKAIVVEIHALNNKAYANSNACAQDKTEKSWSSVLIG